MSNAVLTKEYQCTLSELKEKISLLTQYFEKGHTYDITTRKASLRKLSLVIDEYAEELCEAIYKDFRKPRAEMFLTEIYTVQAEIKHTLANIDRWARRQSVRTNVLLLPASSYIYKSPKGLALIIAPWNYPFYLAMMPLIAAVAAGNVVIIKPASETYHTSLVIKAIIDKVFDEHHVAVVTGEGEETGQLLFEHFTFNHIFFTGSARVGQWIMEQAAKQLCPVTLELGGKSPSIVQKGYDLERAAKKIVWGKFINAGQTCVCSDYALVHNDDYDAFVQCCIKYIHEFFGQETQESSDYAVVINDRRFQKLLTYLDQGKILYGGQSDANTRWIAPTLMDPDMDTDIMKDEIFGPILPIIRYGSLTDIIELVNRNSHPLSLYLFADEGEFRKTIIDKIPFGGGCIHTTVYHLGNPHLPFGGSQKSGIGQYHGQSGFDAFSNLKSILNTAKWFDAPLLYQPYTKNKLALLKKFFQF